MDKFINKNFIYAIIGATNNKAKYGYKVFKDLIDKGFQVIPINPNYKEVAGIDCYPDLISLNERPDVVVLMVSEENAQKIIQDCLDLELDRIWFQPGSEFESAVTQAQEAGFDIMVDKCIMKETNELL